MRAAPAPTHQLEHLNRLGEPLDRHAAERGDLDEALRNPHDGHAEANEKPALATKAATFTVLRAAPGTLHRTSPARLGRRRSEQWAESSGEASNGQGRVAAGGDGVAVDRFRRVDPGARQLGRGDLRTAPLRRDQRGEAECRHKESAALVAHWPPPCGQTPTGSGSGGPARPASARHCRTPCRPPSLETLNVIRPLRSTHSSETYGALHFAHRA